ncbi:MAG: hypothetical protein M1834_005058 [Cirrosporium novae-zelandiae]|nr:MAG: hypothetical protein M1834_005058 [Cirrosporium novae-zelandiae]
MPTHGHEIHVGDTFPSISSFVQALHTWAAEAHFTPRKKENHRGIVRYGCRSSDSCTFAINAHWNEDVQKVIVTMLVPSHTCSGAEHVARRPASSVDWLTEKIPSLMTVTMDTPTRQIQQTLRRHIGLDINIRQIQRAKKTIVQSANPSISRALPSNPALIISSHSSDKKPYLFHHYVTYVAPIMVPLSSLHNPWQTYYPQLASSGSSKGETSLYHSMLSQAAANLSHLYRGEQKENMKTLSMRYYGEAVKDLRESIIDGERDFNVFVAGVLTLIMAEIYSGGATCGRSNAWRLHLEGAWSFLLTYKDDKPWLSDDLTLMTAQSLCLLKIRSHCFASAYCRSFISCCPYAKDDDMSAYLDLTAMIASTRLSFGSTVGATPDLMSCIADIDYVVYQIREGKRGFKEAKEYFIGISERLENCLPVNVNGEDLAPSVATLENSPSISHIDSKLSIKRLESRRARIHIRIFQIGVQIYLYRNTRSPPPFDLVPYVSMLFHLVQTFSNLGSDSGRVPSITLWPVFMAAIEVFREADKRLTREWLNTADQLGIGNRKEVRLIIEEVWRIRTEVARSTKREEGEIVVDWRQVMEDLNLDILLV